MEKADYRLLPLVALGLGKALIEMALKPAVQSLISKLPLPSQEDIDQLVEASIEYYRTPEV